MTETSFNLKRNVENKENISPAELKKFTKEDKKKLK